MLSADVAQCHIQTYPSGGSSLLYLHATAAVTTRAKHSEPKIITTAVSHLLWLHIGVVDSLSTFGSGLRVACVKRRLDHKP